MRPTAASSRAGCSLRDGNSARSECEGVGALLRADRAVSDGLSYVSGVVIGTRARERMIAQRWESDRCGTVWGNRHMWPHANLGSGWFDVNDLIEVMRLVQSKCARLRIDRAAHRYTREEVRSDSAPNYRGSKSSLHRFER